MFLKHFTVLSNVGYLKIKNMYTQKCKQTEKDWLDCVNTEEKKNYKIKTCNFIYIINKF